MAYKATKPTRQVIDGKTVSAAEANKMRQTAERQQSIAQKQSDAALQYDAAGNDKAANRFQTQADSLAGEAQAGLNIQSPYQTSTAKGFNPETMGIDRTTGTQSVTGTMNKELGVIDRTAVDRLMASGLSEADARAQVEANRPDVQEAFNQVGASGLSASQEEQIARFASGEGYGYTPSPAEVANMRASVAAQNKAAKETENMQQQEASRKSNESAASTAASAESTRSTQDGARLDRISAMLDGVIAASGDPMGPVYKEMMMQDLQDKEDAEVSAALSRDASVERAQEQNTDVQDMLDKYISIHKENNDKYTELLDETRDSQQKYLAEQEQRDMERLAWDSDREQEKLAKAKSEQLLSQSIQNALGGGAFSGAANEQLASTEREWDKAISDLAKEFSFKRADVSAFYKQKYIDTNNQFNLDVFNAAKELDAKVEGYSIQGFNSIQAMKNAEVDAQNEYRTAIDTAKKTYSDKISGYVSDLRESLLQERLQKAKDEQEAYDRTWQEFKFATEMNYKSDENALRRDERQDTLDIRRDDKERYNSELFMGKINSQMEGNKVFDQYKDAKMSWESLTTAFSEADNPFRDRAMAKSYEKLVEVGSVVMPGEYADITSNVPLASKIFGKIEKVTSGGQAWTDKEREALKDIGDSLFTAYEKRRNEEAQIFLAAIQFHNQNTSNPSYHLRGSMFNLPDSTTSVQRNTFQQFLPPGYASPFGSGGAGGGGASLGDEIRSLGKITQDFNTEIGTNLYSESTIKAWGGKHKGMDIAMPEGTPVPSFVSGKVISMGTEGGWGKTIIIEDEAGAQHRLSHLSGFPENIREGDAISRGTPIGFSGNTGTSTGPHLDYRVRVNGEYVDPFSYSLS